jgi:hypothetical protein
MAAVGASVVTNPIDRQFPSLLPRLGLDGDNTDGVFVSPEVE